jgi:hypothetical protein
VDISYNIEDEFLKFKDNLKVFPNVKNYVLLYGLFKSKFDRDIHPEIKTKILEIEKSGYYNDHGTEHIKMVICRVSWILDNLGVTFIKEEHAGFYISPYELFILLMAIQLHDAGHLIASRGDHAKKGKELLSKFDSGEELSSSEKKHIGDIAKAHAGTDDPIGKLSNKDDISHQEIRPQLLASLLRLGDELAEDRTRASTFLLHLGNIEPTSEIFHLYSASLDSVKIYGNEIKIDFYIEDNLLVKKYPIKTKNGIGEQYLIDEIYKRTIKTFTESLYCSRFLPDKSRINSVKVNITLLTKEDQDEIRKISYELVESGYPTMLKNDIFEICKSLVENGNKIDGEFINTLVVK